MPASIALVIGSSAVLDDGVSIPRRTGRVIIQSPHEDANELGGAVISPHRYGVQTGNLRL
jgi:hypothetical protein